MNEQNDRDDVKERLVNAAPRVSTLSPDKLRELVARRRRQRTKMRRLTVLAVILCLSAGTGVGLSLAGTGTAARNVHAATTGPTGPTTSTTLPSSSTTIPSTSSTTTISTAPGATVVNSYDPWTSSGTLNPGVAVADTVSGICTMGGAGVYQCLSSSGTTYYECWPKPTANSSQVACDIKWSIQVVIMGLTAPLPPSDSYTPLNGEFLPTVVLANGAQCEEIWGTAPVDGGVGLNYGCTSPSGSQFYAGQLDTSGPTWTISIAPDCVALAGSCKGPLSTENVTQAWK